MAGSGPWKEAGVSPRCRRRRGVQHLGEGGEAGLWRMGRQIGRARRPWGAGPASSASAAAGRGRTPGAAGGRRRRRRRRAEWAASAAGQTMGSRRCAAAARATSAFSAWLRSRPTAMPVGPTRATARRATTPVPQARSSARSPGPGPPTPAAARPRGRTRPGPGTSRRLGGGGLRRQRWRELSSVNGRSPSPGRDGPTAQGPAARGPAVMQPRDRPGAQRPEQAAAVTTALARSGRAMAASAGAAPPVTERVTGPRAQPDDHLLVQVTSPCRLGRRQVGGDAGGALRMDLARVWAGCAPTIGQPWCGYGCSGRSTAEVDGRPVDLGGPRQRAVLALLLAARRGVVSMDRMIDDLWRGEPPPRATGSLQAYVSNLRRLIEPGRSPRAPARLLVSAPPGYALRLADEAVDAWRFERCSAGARARRARPGRRRVLGRGAGAVAGIGVRGVRRRAVGGHRGRAAGGTAPARRRVADRGDTARWGGGRGGCRRGGAHPRAATARGGLAAARPRLVGQRPSGGRAGRAAARPRMSPPSWAWTPGRHWPSWKATSSPSARRPCGRWGHPDAAPPGPARRRAPRPPGPLRRARCSSAARRNLTRWPASPAPYAPGGRGWCWSPGRRGWASRACWPGWAGRWIGGVAARGRALSRGRRRAAGVGVGGGAAQLAGRVPPGEFAGPLAPLLEVDRPPAVAPTRPRDGSGYAVRSAPGCGPPPGPGRLRSCWTTCTAPTPRRWRCSPAASKLAAAPVLVVAAFRPDRRRRAAGGDPGRAGAPRTPAAGAGRPVTV